MLPIRGESTGVVFEFILNKAPVPPVRLNPDLAPKLEEIITKSLEKDRHLRYQLASEIRTDLQRLKRDSDSQKLIAAVAETARGRRLGRFPIAMAIVSTLVMLASISIVIYRHLSTRHLLTINVEKMKVTRLTDSGKVGVAGEGGTIETRMNSASPSHSDFFAVAASRAGLRIRNDELVGSISPDRKSIRDALFVASRCTCI